MNSIIACSSLLLFLAQLRVVRNIKQLFERARIIATVVCRSGAIGIGKLIFGNKIDFANSRRIDADLSSEQINSAFNCCGSLGTPRSAISQCRHSVCDNRTRRHVRIGDVIRAGQHATSHERQERSKTRVGTSFLDHLHVIRQDFSVARATDSNVLNLAATMSKPIHTFGAGLGVTNRSPNSFGQPRKQHVFGIEECFRPKAATNIGSDHTNLFSGQIIKRAELISNRMRSLARLPMCQSADTIRTSFFPTAGCNSSFERARCNALIDDSLAHHHIALREVGGLTSFKIDNGVRSKIGKQQGFIGECFFGVDHGVQRVVVDKNLFGCVDCLST